VNKFKEGDIVQHTSKFLHDIAWYTNVPTDGKVLSVDEELVWVQWCDQEAPNRIHEKNIKMKDAWEPA
jgi:hypothetical protein